MLASWMVAIVWHATLFWSDERLQKKFEESKRNLRHVYTIQHRPLNRNLIYNAENVPKILPSG